MRSLVHLGFLVVAIFPVTAFSAGVAPGEYLATQDGGSLTITPAKNGDVHFAIYAVGANGHTCEVEGDLPRDKTEASVPTANEPCLIRFTPVAKGKGYAVGIPDAALDACQYFCGARASFNQDYLVVPPVCRPKAMKATRAKFKRAYRGKDFVAAAALLRPLLASCSDFLGDYATGFIRNDLALADYHAGDAAGCLQTLAPLMALANLTDEQIRDEYSSDPTYLDEQLRIAKATRTNVKLCSTPPGPSGPPK